jgi:hypothetical protein
LRNRYRNCLRVKPVSETPAETGASVSETTSTDRVRQLRERERARHHAASGDEIVDLLNSFLHWDCGQGRLLISQHAQTEPDHDTFKHWLRGRGLRVTQIAAHGARRVIR